MSVMAGALAALLILTEGAAPAGTDPAVVAQVARIDFEWAHIKYQVPDKSAQFRELQALAVRARALAYRTPARPEPLLWLGIVTSEEAAVASLFQQLGLANAARHILERAEAIDPDAGHGGVAMSLGVLYYKVPGFPIGFGNAKKARAYLQHALALDPSGLDSNYFYGDFLNAQGDRAGARLYLDRALRAPVDAHRPVWDAGRRADARQELSKLG